jgi:hypothetical protein
MSLLLLQTVTAAVLHDVGMGVGSDFGQQFYFFSEDELHLFIIEVYLFHALDGAFLIYDFVDNAIARSNDVFHFESVIEFAISTDELDDFIGHYKYTALNCKKTISLIIRTSHLK